MNANTILANAQPDNAGVGYNKIPQQNDMRDDLWHLDSDSTKPAVANEVRQGLEQSEKINNNVKKREENRSFLNQKPGYTLPDYFTTQVTDEVMMEYSELSNK